MKLVFNRTFRENERMLMRRCGYFEIFNRYTGETSFIRQLRRTPYPRFHLYIQKRDAQSLVMNLHLDSKKPSYSGAAAHAGEYDSEVVNDEAVRLQSILQRL